MLDGSLPFPIPAPAPVTPRPAATTLVVRDDAEGHLEVLMLRRHANASFMPGVHVFPGGNVDAEDGDPGTLARCDEAPETLELRLGLPPGGAAYAVAALRECHEECGLWLGADAMDGRWHVSALHPWAHWITPRGLPKRFDTRFFVAAAPRHQVARHDARETDGLRWVRPAVALQADDMSLVFVTRRILQSLAPHRDVASLMAAASGSTVREVVHPRLCQDLHGARVPVDPGHPAYAEVSRLDPDGAGTVSATIRPGVPVRLGQAVWRLTAPNAGPMSGPGTNTYLLGRGGRWVVLDPGPLDDSHLEALMRLTSGRVEAIVVTHTHRDHSPAAVRLAGWTGAPCVGLPPPRHGRQDGSFRPDVQPADGQVFDWAGVRLEAVHTPGHASNHVCWWLAEEALLFTGDHLMQGSTVVIDPPDGDMAMYLESLRRLPDRLPALAWLAPGHGFLMGHPQRAIAHLLRHRQAREDKVLAALMPGMPLPLPALLERVYDDVAALLRPAAERSLLAHLQKLRQEGRAHDGATGWCRTC